jgi:hypothetical protein
MAEPRPSLILPIVLVVLVIVGAGVGVGLLYEYNHPAPRGPTPTVAVGDNVTVNYIGVLGSGPQAGRVFDTSLYSVATNNVSYPKSLEFAYRGSAANYTPLPVLVGPSGSYTIGNLTFGTVVTGFWQGLIGVPTNHTISITVPPDLGYGPVISNCTAVRPLTVTVPVQITVTLSEFATAYPGETPTPGTEFTDPSYGWTDFVLSSNSTGAVVVNLPPLGWKVPSASWPIVVTGLNSTVITLTNQLTAQNDGVTLGNVPSTTVCGTHRFLVTSVNSLNGTYSVLYDYSSSAGGHVSAEIQGQTLVFQVTVVRIY